MHLKVSKRWRHGRHWRLGSSFISWMLSWQGCLTSQEWHYVSCYHFCFFEYSINRMEKQILSIACSRGNNWGAWQNVIYDCNYARNCQSYEYVQWFSCQSERDNWMGHVQNLWAPCWRYFKWLTYRWYNDSISEIPIRQSKSFKLTVSCYWESSPIIGPSSWRLISEFSYSMAW
jgi:hypothetical protein